MSRRRIELGRWGENLAAVYLHTQGLQEITRNWRCEAGEIDLIMLDGETLVFVEVRTLRSANKLWPEETITPKKQAHLLAAAEYYILENNYEGNWRIDVVAIVGSPGHPHDIQWFPNAIEGGTLAQ